MQLLNELMVDVQPFDNVIPFASKRVRQPRQSTSLDATFQGGLLDLHYQPQFELENGSIRGLEALLRVTKQDGSFLSAADVVAKAEGNGCINLLGNLVLNKACSDFSAMRSTGCSSGKLAVNVSPLELRQANYVELVADAVAAAGLEFHNIELEITENWPLSDPSLYLEQLTTLADLGVSIAIDDFGVAHANWASVTNLPISTLKIDRSLISRLGTCERTLRDVASLCQACTELELDIVAEGVCNAEQRGLLLAMKCGAAQGYGLARPTPAHKVMTLRH
jgi:EAL domain-containing protein (putative c-di-GMP-specific phosphodiesterase class I)